MCVSGAMTVHSKTLKQEICREAIVTLHGLKLMTPNLKISMIFTFFNEMQFCIIVFTYSHPVFF